MYQHKWNTLTFSHSAKLRNASRKRYKKRNITSYNYGTYRRCYNTTYGTAQCPTLSHWGSILVKQYVEFDFTNKICFPVHNLYEIIDKTEGAIFYFFVDKDKTMVFCFQRTLRSFSNISLCSLRYRITLQCFVIMRIKSHLNEWKVLELVVVWKVHVSIYSHYIWYFW